MTILGIGLSVGALLLFGLYELQRLPYRPPHDMRTLLSAEAIVVVRLLMASIAVFWTVGLLFLLSCMRGGGASATCERGDAGQRVQIAREVFILDYGTTPPRAANWAAVVLFCLFVIGYVLLPLMLLILVLVATASTS